jgi:hypothetical protein
MKKPFFLSRFYSGEWHSGQFVKREIRKAFEGVKLFSHKNQPKVRKTFTETSPLDLRLIQRR